MDLNDKDLEIKSWNWAFGYLKKQVTSDSVDMQRITNLIQSTALLTSFIEAITVMDDNSHFVVSFKGTDVGEEVKFIQHFASLDEDCKDGSISVPSYMRHILERQLTTLVLLLEAEDGRYNYREYCGVELIHAVEGNGLDPETPADYQMAFSVSDFHDVVVSDCGYEIVRVGAVEIVNKDTFINTMSEALEVATKTKSMRGKMLLNQGIQRAVRKGKKR